MVAYLHHGESRFLQGSPPEPSINGLNTVDDGPVVSSSIFRQPAVPAAPSTSTSSSASPLYSTSSHFNSLPPFRRYDYVLKFLLVGDSDVGKDEILQELDDAEDNCGTESYAMHNGNIGYKSTVILLDGKRVKLQLWDTSGQGRFGTIIRSYSRGAQGILVVYDITNRWSFDGIKRWLKEIDEHAPGIPKILIGNRLHLEFKRAVFRDVAECFAAKNNMDYFEVSPLVDFNIHESLTQLARLVLRRSRMAWMHGAHLNKVLSLQDICCRCIVGRLHTVYDADSLPLPGSLRTQLRSFAHSSLLVSSCFVRRPISGNHFRTGSDFSIGSGSPAGSIGSGNLPPDASIPRGRGFLCSPVSIKDVRGSLTRRHRPRHAEPRRNRTLTLPTFNDPQSCQQRSRDDRRSCAVM